MPLGVSHVTLATSSWSYDENRRLESGQDLGNGLMTTTSQSLQGTEEITLVARLKTGLVPIQSASLSYASRLRVLLGALFSERKAEVEDRRQYDSFLESLEMIHIVHWAILDNETKLLLAVSFDGPWEPYIRRIVDKAGPFLDAIFCHCDDYEGSMCSDGYQKFAAWVRSKQQQLPYVYGANPDLTIDDARYLREFERTYSQAGAGTVSGGLTMPSVVAPPSQKPMDEVYALFRLSSFFPEGSDTECFNRLSTMILTPDITGPLLPAMLPRLPAPTTERQGAMGLWLQDRFKDCMALGAAATAQATSSAARAANPISAVDARDTIQGNILTSYSPTDEDSMSHGCVALLHFYNGAGGAALLGFLLQQELITCEPPANASVPAGMKLNIALTFQGLRTLGLTDAAAAKLPKEFQEGLAARAALLGDVGDNHPDGWLLPDANWQAQPGPGQDPILLSLVDAVLILQTKSDSVDDGAGLLPKIKELLASLQDAVSGFEILHTQPMRRYGTKGHLGVVDGVSQPVAQGEPLAAPFAPQDRVALGDLLLGYPNGAGDNPAAGDPLLKNSTFIAIRKMEQNVAPFLALNADQRRRALGRDENGISPLVTETPAPGEKSNNEFNYGAKDSDQSCPFFAHARRANPRQSAPGDVRPPPRILRRGMSYGPQYVKGDKSERGVMFMAIAASLAEQYEIVQRWVNGGNSTGVLSAHPDLVAGTFPDNSGRFLRYRTTTGQEKTLAVPSKPPATLRWGLYALLPSTSAIEFLIAVANGRASYGEPAQIAAPEPAPEPETQFGAQPLNERGRIVKATLEDQFNPNAATQAWADVLDEGGIKREPDYAVLVSRPDLVERALTEPSTFSVRSYWARMEACQATIYLGMDPDPKPLTGDQYTEQVHPGDYQHESQAANRFAEQVTFERAFQLARDAALTWFGEQKAQHSPILELDTLAARVIRDVASSVFEIPKELLLEFPDVVDDAKVRCPADLTAVFAHVFPPRPTRAVSEVAATRGPVSFDKVKAWLAAGGGGALVDALKQATDPLPDYVPRTVVGLLSGFAVPTNGTLMGVLTELVISEQLWRLQRLKIDAQLAAKGADLNTTIAPLRAALYQLMMGAPIPETVHRTVVKKTRMGHVDLEPGDMVALHLKSAAAQCPANGLSTPWKFLFGDTPNAGQHATHRCPGQNMAFGVMLGTLVALLSQKRLAPSQNPTVLGVVW
jgi:Dyp-type peroxidase family